MKHVVMFSGGIASWATAKRVPHDDKVLLFADTLIEDPDLYRFLDEGAANAGGELVRLADGRTPWDVFYDVGYIGNTRVDPCSRVLKRDLLRGWLEENCDPDDTVVYLGFDWTELNRAERAAKYWDPWHVECPLTEKPYLDRDQLEAWLEDEGIELPRLYKMGFPHNNCGGFCVKAGQGQFVKLLELMPERYRYHELHEEFFRSETGKDVAILRRRTGSWHSGTEQTFPLTMRELRQRVEDEAEVDRDEVGGCACFDGDFT